MKTRLWWLALGGVGGGVSVLLLLMGLAFLGSPPTALAGSVGLPAPKALLPAQEDPWQDMHAACVKGDYAAMWEAMRRITPEEMERMHQSSPEEMMRRMGMSPEQMSPMMQDDSMRDMMRQMMGGFGHMMQRMMGGIEDMMRGMMGGMMRMGPMGTRR